MFRARGTSPKQINSFTLGDVFSSLRPKNSKQLVWCRNPCEAVGQLRLTTSSFCSFWWLGRANGVLYVPIWAVILARTSSTFWLRNTSQNNGHSVKTTLFLQDQCSAKLWNAAAKVKSLCNSTNVQSYVFAVDVFVFAFTLNCLHVCLSWFHASLQKWSVSCCALASALTPTSWP